jgi:glycosyltransferase involved in cell wall biosynthesis
MITTGRMNVAVVLPAHNEAGNLTPLVDELVRTGAAAAIGLDIVVVNDGSEAPV